MHNSILERLKDNIYTVQGTKALIYCSPGLLDLILRDRSVEQLRAAASLPGVVGNIIGMPDIHEGFGLPIGGVMAMDYDNGLISAGAVGMDINCGVRLLETPIQTSQILRDTEAKRTLMIAIQRYIPMGVGRERTDDLGLDLKTVTEKGIPYLKQKGYALSDDVDHTEENGYFYGANVEKLSAKAVHRSRQELGTLGSGNHFIEIQNIQEVYNESIAHQFGLYKGFLSVMIHSGSRAMGHQVCTDYTDIFWNVKQKYGLDIPQKGLAAVPIHSPEGQDYFAAMAASINFAFANRQIMTYFIRQAFQDLFRVPEHDIRLVYDVAHNIAKIEEHKGKSVLVHRKGATRALPKKHKYNPERYKETGHPVLVPGSMGTASYVLVGTEKAEETFYSVNHGAGRTMSRHQAFREVKESDFNRSMEGKMYNLSFRNIADEAPQAYKDIEQVVDVLVQEGICTKVAKLEPLIVLKGD